VCLLLEPQLPETKKDCSHFQVPAIVQGKQSENNKSRLKEVMCAFLDIIMQYGHRLLHANLPCLNEKSHIGMQFVINIKSTF
jgi:hypothetical protein